MKEKNKKVFVGMSGGVDSSVAALLLKRKGYNVVGVFIRGYNLDGCAERDAEDARRTAEHLAIPFYVWDFKKEYKAKVVNYMIDSYRRGETPNPDVMCNKEIKFGLFFERAMSLGADYIATGHYVRRHYKRTLKGSFKSDAACDWTLGAAKDKNKDQSYFLWTLPPKQIEKSLFPIGNYLKPEVRRIAKKAGLPAAEKKDSQGICFLGQVSIKDFLKRFIPEKRGAVFDLKGEKIGEHQGAWYYTIGQRGGVGNLKHKKGQKNHKPFYVAKKDVKKNILVAAEGENNPALYKKSVYLTDLNLCFRPKTGSWKSGLPVLTRVRYRQPLFPATFCKLKAKNYKLVFKNPQKFATPGQSAVLYNGKGWMLGGGIIR